MKKSIFVFFVASLFLVACQSGEPKTDDKAETEKAEMCTYSILDSSPVSVSWTAYKTSAKVGVGGKFTQVSFSGAKPAGTILGQIMGRKFQILTDSTNTGNPDRDAKIVEFFWNKMVETQQISGYVSAASGNDKAGEATFALTLNGVEKNAKFTYEVGADKVTLNGVIDLNNWNAQDAVASLNEACKELHTGKDGVSKTWPDVAIVIEVGYSKECK